MDIAKYMLPPQNADTTLIERSARFGSFDYIPAPETAKYNGHTTSITDITSKRSLSKYDNRFNQQTLTNAKFDSHMLRDRNPLYLSRRATEMAQKVERNYSSKSSNYASLPLAS